MPENRYFTVEEANEMIPSLTERFGRILQMRAQVRTLHRTLEQFGETPSPETLEQRDGPQEVRAARGKFRALMEALREEIHFIDQTGVEVKDLDTGLCDFRTRRYGRDILLCWQYGEKRIGYWHELTTGFAGRQPIEDEPPPPQFVH